MDIHSDTVFSSYAAKEKELIALLERNGFVNRGGKGSHKNFVHPSGERLTILG